MRARASRAFRVGFPMDVPHLRRIAPCPRCDVQTQNVLPETLGDAGPCFMGHGSKFSFLGNVRCDLPRYIVSNAITSWCSFYFFSVLLLNPQPGYVCGDPPFHVQTAAILNLTAYVFHRWAAFGVISFRRGEAAQRRACDVCPSERIGKRLGDGEG